MEPQPSANSDVPVLGYAEPGPGRKPFSLLTLFLGLIIPYVYAAVSLVVISPFGFRGSGMEAFYALHPAALIAMAVFPLIVWQLSRRIPTRGFMLGAVIGTLVLPALALVALAISFSHGV